MNRGEKSRSGTLEPSDAGEETGQWQCCLLSCRQELANLIAGEAHLGLR